MNKHQENHMAKSLRDLDRIVGDCEAWSGKLKALSQHVSNRPVAIISNIDPPRNWLSRYWKKVLRWRYKTF